MKWEPIETMPDHYYEGDAVTYEIVYNIEFESYSGIHKGFKKEGKIWSDCLAIYSPQPTHWLKIETTDGLPLPPPPPPPTLV